MGVVIISMDNKLEKCDNCYSTNVVLTGEGYICRACGYIAISKTKSIRASNDRDQVTKKSGKSIKRISRYKSIDQFTLFSLKDQIAKLLKTKGKTSEEIDQILKDMNDDKKKLNELFYKLNVNK